MNDLLRELWVDPLPQLSHYWTDGSVMLSEAPWYSLGSCAAIDSNGSLVFADRVYHFFARVETPCVRCAHVIFC